MTAKTAADNSFQYYRGVSTNGEQLFDKRQVWQDATDQLEEIIGTSWFQHCRSAFYLDKLEDGEAIIACPGQFDLEQFGRRKLKERYEIALCEVTGQFFKVSLAKGKQEIPAATSGTRTPSGSTVQAMGIYAFTQLENLSQEERKEALELLLNKWGDIMGIVDNHPTFKNIIKPTKQGGWGSFPQVLTNYCKDYGVLQTLRTIKHTAEKASVKFPRSYFKWAMETKQMFGPLLFVPKVPGDKIAS